MLLLRMLLRLQGGRLLPPSSAHHFSVPCLSWFLNLLCTTSPAADLGHILCISETIILRTGTLYLFHFPVNAICFLFDHSPHTQHNGQCAYSVGPITTAESLGKRLTSFSEAVYNSFYQPLVVRMETDKVLLLCVA